MALQPCPQCGLLRTPDDLVAAACPVCGHRAGEAIPTASDTSLSANSAPAPTPEPVRPRDPDAGQWQNWALVGVVVLVAGIVFAVLLRDSLNSGANSTEPDWTEPAPDSHSTPTPEPASWLEVAPMPREYVWQPLLPDGPELAPYPRPIVFVPITIRVNRPDEDFTLDRLGDGNHIRLVGRVKRLMLQGATDGAIIDATELDAKDVYIYGRIEGGSTVKVKSANGKIIVRDGIGGGATVIAESGEGTVEFPTSSKNKKGVITEGANVTVSGKSVYFWGVIDGSGTRVNVTVAANGGLKFTTMAGTAQLLYRPASPMDPSPRLSAGEVRGDAECRRVD